MRPEIRAILDELHAAEPPWVSDRHSSEYICLSCHGWNHWHLPDGPCLDPYCTCTYRDRP